MPEKEDDLDVSTVDEVSDTAHSHTRPRKLSEYSATNSPLSQNEITLGEARDKDDTGWVPRTTEDIGDLKPLPEKAALPKKQ